MDTYKKTVVIDNGSWTMRAGFAGDHTPRVVFPSVVGKPKPTGQKYSSDTKNSDIFIGNVALNKRGTLTIKYPIMHGLIVNWDDIEIVWRHIFDVELKSNPEEHPVLLTEPSMNPKCNREKMTEVMFETFGVPAVYVSPQSTLSLFSCGRVSGVVLHVGHHMCFAVPVYEGHTLTYAVVKNPIGGGDLTDYMMKLLNERGYSFTTCAERDIVSDMKEKLCYVSQDFKKDINSPTETIQESYTLPDGRIITVDKERFKCPEALFDPFLVGYEMFGVHDTLCNAIKRCNEDIVSDLYSNIIVSGGSTVFPGFRERLHKEITELSPDQHQIDVIAPKGRENSAWIGGSEMSNMSTFKDMWIDKDEYDEFGPVLVHWKCF